MASWRWSKTAAAGVSTGGDFEGRCSKSRGRDLVQRVGAIWCNASAIWCNASAIWCNAAAYGRKGFRLSHSEIPLRDPTPDAREARECQFDQEADRRTDATVCPECGKRKQRHYVRC